MFLEANHPNPVVTNSAGVCQYDITNAIINYNDWKHLNRNRITFELARARPAVPLGLWSITSSLRGNLYVPRLHKFIKWFADNDVAHRN